MKQVTSTIRDGVGILRLGRAKRLNAIDPEIMEGLIGAVEGLTRRPDVDALVLLGCDRAFSTGADLDAVGALSGTEFRRFLERLQVLAGLVHHARQPSVAAIRGFAFGGGLELAVNCDARIATEDASFATPEVQWGLTVTNGASALLRRLVGEGCARDMTLFGRTLGAQEALSRGLITRIVAAEQLEEAALAMAAAAAAASAPAVAATKRLLNMPAPAWDALVRAEVDEVMRAYDAGEVTRRLQRRRAAQ